MKMNAVMEIAAPSSKPVASNSGALRILLLAAALLVVTASSGTGATTSTTNLHHLRHRAVPPPPPDDADGGVPPSDEPDTASDGLRSNRDALGNALLRLYRARNINGETLRQPGTPQNLALEWVAGSANFASLSDARRAQRFVLAAFYYSTYKQPNLFYHDDDGGGDGAPDGVLGWTSAANWMAPDGDECDWEGIACDDGGAVTEVSLPGHNLSGELPVELAFLSETLRIVDLSSNQIYVNGDDDNAERTPFRHLDRVTSLIMDDNFVLCSRGLPAGIGEMTSLRKLDFSYNLLQGPIDGTAFENLGQLQHFEVEANYLSGGLPIELLLLPNLTYLYIRRNNLDLDLAEIFANGTLPSLFAFWVDNNNVVGPIPPSIATKTGLASLSIADSSLGGLIPVEMGQLQGLRRVWLYRNQLTGQVPAEVGDLQRLEVFEVHDNDLTGTMPPGVCEAVRSSQYSFKALTADCAEVLCEDCCTACY